jgi:hypothetical protein
MTMTQDGFNPQAIGLSPLYKLIPWSIHWRLACSDNKALPHHWNVSMELKALNWHQQNIFGAAYRDD